MKGFGTGFGRSSLISVDALSSL